MVEWEICFSRSVDNCIYDVQPTLRRFFCRRHKKLVALHKLNRWIGGQRRLTSLSSSWCCCCCYYWDRHSIVDDHQRHHKQRGWDFQARVELKDFPARVALITEAEDSGSKGHCNIVIKLQCNKKADEGFSVFQLTSSVVSPFIAGLGKWTRWCFKAERETMKTDND